MGKAMTRRRKHGAYERTRCGVPMLWAELFGCLSSADEDDRAQLAAAKARRAEQYLRSTADEKPRGSNADAHSETLGPAESRP